MHEPIGFSGVHDGAEHLAVARLLHAAQDRAALAGLVVRRPTGTRCRSAPRRRTRAYVVLDPQRAVRHLAQAAPFERAAQLEHFGDERLAPCALPSRVTARVNSFSTSARPSLSCRTSIRIACMTSSGSKPAITTGLRVFLGEVLVGLAADHRRHVRRADEAVERHGAELAHFRRLEDVGDRRRRQHVVAEDAEVGEPVALPPRRMATAVGGVVVSKPIAKNTTSRCGMLAARCAARRRTNRPSGCRRRAPSPSAARARPTPARASCRRRCTGSGPVARRARSRCRCGRSAVRTPGSPGRGSCDVRRQQVRERRSARSHACGRRRTPSGCSGAPARASRRDRRGELARERAVAEFVDVFHRLRSRRRRSRPPRRTVASVRSASSGIELRQRVADVHDHVVADADVVDERERDLLAHAVEIDDARRRVPAARPRGRESRGTWSVPPFCAASATHAWPSARPPSFGGTACAPRAA